MAPFGAFLFFHHFFNGAGKLVGAGGASSSAIRAAKPLYHVFGLHADDERGDPLCIAVAAAGEFHFFYYTVFNRYVDLTGTNALRLINGCFCHINFPFRNFIGILYIFYQKKPEKTIEEKKILQILNFCYNCTKMWQKFLRNSNAIFLRKSQKNC